MKIRKFTDCKEGQKCWIHVYRGFESQRAVLDYGINVLKVNSQHLVIVRFMGEYYGLLHEGSDKQVVFGEHSVIYKSEGKWKRETRGFEQLPYTIGKLSKQTCNDRSFLTNMFKIDSDPIVYIYKFGAHRTVNYLYTTNFLKMLWDICFIYKH